MKTYAYIILKRSFALLVLIFMFACQKEEKNENETPDIKESRSPLKNNRIKSAPIDSVHKDSLQSVPDTIKPAPLMNYQHFKKTFSIHRKGFISLRRYRQQNFAV